jgi:hypothetical protein
MDRCEVFQSELEVVASERSQQTMEAQDLLLAMSAESRSHGVSCEECRAAVEDLLGARKLLRQGGSERVVVGPWFVPRVMAAIALRERELVEKSKTWVLVPKVASRLSWVTATALVLTTAWLYQRPGRDVGTQMRAESGSESLFDNTQPPATQDDVLLSLGEKNQ